MAVEASFVESVADEFERDFQPQRDFVLLKEIPQGQTAGGIEIPETASAGPRKAKVVSVGPGLTTESGSVVKPGVNAGDTVYLMLTVMEPLELGFGPNKYLVARDRDIIGKCADEQERFDA